MARGLFMLACLLLVLVVQHGVQTASANRSEEIDPAPVSWRKTVIDQLSELKDEIRKSSNGGNTGQAVVQLVPGLTTMQSSDDASCSSMKEDIKNIRLRLQKTEEELREVRDLGLKNRGSIFVRWGRTTCSRNTTLVYSGVAAGKQYYQKGSGTNTLCLTRFPQFDNTTAHSTHHAYLYGGEYEAIQGHHDQDVPCSVCRAPQSTTIMMAATLTCPQGWTAQYTGHLTSQHHDYYATEYVCLDGKPEDFPGGTEDDNGRLFYYVLTVCGSLPCPPYANRKVVTCVVCSK